MRHVQSVPYLNPTIFARMSQSKRLLMAILSNQNTTRALDWAVRRNINSPRNSMDIDVNSETRLLLR